MTKKLYLDDPYLQEFSSAVTQKIDAGDRPGIILEQTLFYPTSGGQPHDTGMINGIPVIDVFEDQSHRIVHLLAEPVADRQVAGRIDWQRRFDHMQQHSGQHLLSQSFIKTCDAETISFHMGDESATLDLNQAGLSIEKIAAVEDLANQVIYESRPVLSHTIGKDDLDQYPVRKPPAVDDNIRVVEIKDFDYSACGGTHCSRTGEIGIVKIRRFENYKGGTRIHFLCGLRALKDYQAKSMILKQIGEYLSAGESDLYKNIKKIRNELKLLRREHGNLKKQYLNYEANALFSERKEVENINIIAKVFEDRNPKELKILAQKVMENFPNTIILFGAKTEGKASLFFIRSEELAGDMGKLMQDACAVINGRGGGRPQQAQGGGPAADKLDAAVQYAYERVSIRK
jgi:alanyl-tRNA synthetase